MDEKEFIRRLKEASLERDEEKRLYAAGLLNEALKKYGSKIIVVGGSIVALYTVGHYTTADIDVVAKKRDSFKEIMHQLGFEDVSSIRYVHQELGLIVEYMGEKLNAETTDIIKIKDLEIETISIEDILISKLEMLERGVDTTKSEKQIKIIAYLLGGKIDEEYLMKRMVNKNISELWTRIKSEVDEYGP